MIDILFCSCMEDALTQHVYPGIIDSFEEYRLNVIIVKKLF